MAVNIEFGMIREATDNDREAIIQLIDEIFQNTATVFFWKAQKAI